MPTKAAVEAFVLDQNGVATGIEISADSLKDGGENNGHLDIHFGVNTNDLPLNGKVCGTITIVDTDGKKSIMNYELGSSIN